MSDQTTEKAMLSLSDKFPWADNLDKLSRAIHMARGTEDEVAVKKYYISLKGKVLENETRKEHAPINVDPVEKIGGNATNSTAPKETTVGPVFADMTKDELMTFATEAGIEVNARMSKQVLIDAIEAAQNSGGAVDAIDEKTD